MDDESGESMELMEEVPFVGMGEAVLERLIITTVSSINDSIRFYC